MIRLIIGSAFIDDSKRIDDYIKSFELISRNKNLFDEICIIETISNNIVPYIEDSGFDTFYSKIGNISNNKGVNWMHHIENYLNNKCEDEDIIIFISGRYMLKDDNNISIIIKYLVDENLEFIAKSDGDIFDGMGVHSFLIFFKKKKFIEFIDYYKVNRLNCPCVEHDLSKFLSDSERCMILPTNFYMGIETNYYLSTIKGIC